VRETSDCADLNQRLLPGALAAMTKRNHKRSLGSDEADTADQKVLQVARRVAATIGSDFFQVIAKHLAKALATDGVLIGEFVGGRVEAVRTLGAYMDGHPASFEYELAGSASTAILLGRPCQCRKDAPTRFPSDTLISQVRAEALVGAPLVDPAGRPIGLIMALYRSPVASFAVPLRLLQIFSARASGELNRKREQDRLRESEQRYKVFIARNADAMWRIEFERPIDISLSPQAQLDEMYERGYVAECNDALAAFLGLRKAEQVIGMHLGDIAPQSDPQMLSEARVAIARGYELSTVETSRIDPSGKQRYFLRSQWGIVEDGKLERLWGTSRDITELKESQQQLDASEQRMANLLETMKLGVIIEDPNGLIAHCNRCFYRKTGWRATEVAGKSWLDQMVPADEHARLHALFDREKTKADVPIHFDCTLLGPKGQKWCFEWDRTSLRDSQGNISAWANLGRDVTQCKALEARVQQTQKLATIGELAGGVAHDFNNLLTVILGYSFRLLEHRTPADPEFLALDEIHKAAAKGAELTHRLLAFGRRQALNPEVLEINSIIKDAEHMLRRLIGDDVRSTIDLDPSVGQVFVDAGSFHQVLMNLALNARDAMPHGGTLRISTSKEVLADPLQVPGVAPGEYIVVTVSDTGTGMTADVRKHLFEPFFTTKHPGRGTGLGLATVYGIVQQSGGSILVETEAGKGTTFRIYLPWTKMQARRKRSNGTQKAMQGGSETILLVEDREDVRELTAHTLHELGYQVLEADGSDLALRLAQDRSRQIHLLLTDIVMPGIKGFELANLVESYQRGVKVLFMSGYSDPSQVGAFTSRPDHVYLQKPFTPGALADVVRRLLDRTVKPPEQLPP
jgi:two-component system, cell cycle sensor histidine kinase and response regulator CckA